MEEQKSEEKKASTAALSSSRIDRIEMFKEPLVALGIDEYDPVVISAIAEYARSNA